MTGNLTNIRRQRIKENIKNNTFTLENYIDYINQINSVQANTSKEKDKNNKYDINNSQNDREVNELV